MCHDGANWPLADGDIDLLANDEHWDIHAIAGLLKWYFRDLPVSVLDEQQTAFVQSMGTPHPSFRVDPFTEVQFTDLADPQQRIRELARLVSLLPLENYSLLRALCSHLILIIQHASENKMTLKNVSIILAPTIGKTLPIVTCHLLNFSS
jgi:RalA-binding protein 1